MTSTVESATSGAPSTPRRRLRGNRFTVAGRTFMNPPDTTFDQDNYQLEHLRAAGVYRLVEAGARGAVPEDEVLVQIRTSGHALEALAGSVVEVAADGTPIPWTRAWAREAVAFFGGLTGDDKLVVAGQLTAFLFDFFVLGTASSTTSPNSSSPSASADPAGAGAAAVPAGASAARSTAASGAS